jgi:hypothetical protein
MDVRYADEIRDDLLVSMAWMDERRDGLGDELEAEFYAAVSVVQERPYSFGADDVRPIKPGELLHARTTA